MPKVLVNTPANCLQLHCARQKVEVMVTWKCTMMVACRGVTVRSKVSLPTRMVSVTLPRAGLHFSFLGAFRS